MNIWLKDLINIVQILQNKYLNNYMVNRMLNISDKSFSSKPGITRLSALKINFP